MNILLFRTSLVNASVALRQIKKGRASGNKAALVIRSKFQKHLYDIGCVTQRNPGTILFIGLLALSSALVGLKSAKIETSIDELLVEAGGRLEKEIDYVKETLGDGYENTNQMLIQTPNNDNQNILHPDALLSHLEVLKVGTQVSVDMFSTTWRLKDICYTLSIPAFEEQLIDAALDKLIPCAIITPLDCFWEGSKLLGPDITIPVINLNFAWTTFNPQSLIELAKNRTHSGHGSHNRYPFETFENLMSRAGISTAYQRRPCLNPLDEECPESAPNKHTNREPDVSYELSGGCYGFATKWMHWPEQLIIGGIKKNKNGRIVKAHALQSIIQLMAEQDMFAYWQDNARVLHIDWTIEKARQVLEAWQRKFVSEVDRFIKENSIVDYKIEKFTNVALLDIIKNFSIPNATHLLIGYFLFLIFTAISRINIGNPSYSLSTLGICGVLLIVLSIASGLGFCCLLGFTFNASTTQIIPFLSLALGSAPLFFLMDAYEENICKDTRSKNPIADTLQQAGFSILLNSFSLLCALGAATIIPIPALRYFAAQNAILLTFITISLLTIFPAIMSLDLARRNFSISSKTKNNDFSRNVSTETPLYYKLTLDNFVENIYLPLFHGRFFKFLVMIISCVIYLICLSGVPQVKDGLDLTDIVPRDTSEYRFLHNQKQYFSVYNMHAVTQGNFEYPTNQALLIDYHNAFTRVPRIIKNDDGGLPEFWLTMFRDWLIGLQNSFDKDWKNGAISQERWYDNASAEGILGYKLLVQTGRVDNPVDKSLVKKTKLVDSRGIINPKAFYNYLTAWVTNDAIAYSASQANFHPQPRQWIHVASDYDLKIPKSQPLTYAEIPFYLHNMNSTEEITSTIQEIRTICKVYEEKGLPNFPTGLPFKYWEQYIRLRLSLGASLIVAFAAIFVAFCALLVNCWASSLLIFVLALTSVQIFGFMGLLKIRLSAIPAVILIIAVGKSIHILIHLLMSFLTSMGKRDYRISAALHHMFPSLVRSEISTFIPIGMLAFSEFDFVNRDFFYIFSGAVAISSWNGLIFYPLLLLYFGPPGELIPIEHENRISTPSPPRSPPAKKRHHHNLVSYSRRIYPRVQSEISLSTISEEPPSHKSSHEIVVQPELVVETTTVTNTGPHLLVHLQLRSDTIII